MSISKEVARETLDAIDLVCSLCDYIPEDESGCDPCEGCNVVVTYERMMGVIYETQEN